MGLTLLFAIAAGIYAVVMFSTPVLDNLDVKEKVAAAFNQSNHTSDEALKKFIEEGLRQVGEHDEDDGYGTVRTVKGLGLTDDNITIERNEVARTIYIRVDYVRRILLSPTKRIYELKLHAEQSGTIPP